MPINEFIIWLSLGALGVGLDKVTTNLIYGLILSFVGAVGAAYGIREHFRDAKANWSRIIAALVIVVTWSAVGYDIYGQRHSGNSFPSDWETYAYQEIDNYKFSHVTVHLDGRKFVNCSFDNVTFEFEGKEPFLFVPYPPPILGPVQIFTADPLVKASFNTCFLGSQPKAVENTNVLP